VRRAIAAALFAIAAPAPAAEISTHILDLARGVGGRGVPVTLSRRSPDGAWKRVAATTTDADGRVRSFGDTQAFGPGLYRLDFDMTAFPNAGFFPEITVNFRVEDAKAHYHVPVVVSPYGYSTYRGT